MGGRENISAGKVRIVLIDSGVDTRVPELRGIVIESTAFCINEDGTVTQNNDIPVRHSHGTAIALVIKHLCEDIELESINILNERLVTDGRVLMRAIEYAINKKPDIIHMSLGTTKWKYFPRMSLLVWKARKNKTFIVSAANNKGLISFPAYIRGVIRVKSCMKSSNDKASKDKYFYNKPFFMASPITEAVPGIKGLEGKRNTGNSMAAAYITGHLANIMRKNIDKKSCKKLLIEIAKKIYP